MGIPNAERRENDLNNPPGQPPHENKKGLNPGRVDFLVMSMGYLPLLCSILFSEYHEKQPKLLDVS